MRSLLLSETRTINGGKTKYVYCEYCDASFKYTYWFWFTEAANRGKAVLKKQDHFYAVHSDI